MTRPALLLALAISLTASPLHAQASSGKNLQSKGTTSFGPGFALNFPASDLGDYAATGWGVFVQGTMGRGVFTLLGEIGYDHFGADVDLGDEGGTYDADVNPWHFGAGIRTTLGPIYVAGLAGYWTEVEDFDVVPMAGLHIWKLDVGARYKGLLGDGDWFALTAAIHFGKW